MSQQGSNVRANCSHDQDDISQTDISMERDRLIDHLAFLVVRQYYRRRRQATCDDSPNVSPGCVPTQRRSL